MGFTSLNLTKTEAPGNVHFVISNSIDGMMLKTKDVGRPDFLKQAFKNATGASVKYSVKGPMSSKFTFSGIACAEVSNSLGGYLLASPASGTGGPIKINISTYLNDTSGNCDLFLQILIYSHDTEEYSLGQFIFQNYNVTWDHDNNLVGFVQQPVTPYSEPH